MLIGFKYVLKNNCCNASPERKSVAMRLYSLHMRMLQATVQHITSSFSELPPCPVVKGFFVEFSFGYLTATR